MEEENETYFLEESLFRIGRLLGLCFGQAGAKIIGLNISTADSGVDFNPKLHGEFVEGIYGYCNIRNFTDVCVALQSKIMLFVN